MVGEAAEGLLWQTALGLIGPAPDLPERAISTLFRHRGELRLMCTLLLSGLDELAREVARESRRKFCFAGEHEMMRWVIERGERYLYSFESVCIHLELNADGIRKLLIRACHAHDPAAIHAIARRLRSEWRFDTDFAGFGRAISV